MVHTPSCVLLLLDEDPTAVELDKEPTERITDNVERITDDALEQENPKGIFL